eukprot:13887472-Heterocapsa_arctica.AAC.1
MHDALAFVMEGLRRGLPHARDRQRSGLAELRKDVREARPVVANGMASHRHRGRQVQGRAHGEDPTQNGEFSFGRTPSAT